MPSLRSLMRAALLTLGVASASANVVEKWVNITSYRVTPKNYKGVTNMDSGSSIGDAYFGLAQLALPIICKQDPDFLWCQNDAALHGKDTTRFDVYSEFTMSAKALDGQFGDYAECNPDRVTKIFNCTHMHHGGGQQKCWYDDATVKAAFAKYCDASVCSCHAYENRALGQEVSPMCRDGASNPASRARRSLRQHHGPPPPPMKNPYWKCSAAVHDTCAHSFHTQPAQCEACAVTNKKALDAAGCSDAMVPHACANGMDSYSSCDGELRKVCDGKIGPSTCFTCADKNTAALEAANCTEELLDYACGGGHHHGGGFEENIQKLACNMNGTWYSTQAAGECKGASDTDCWWRLNKIVTTVNASCVDNNVVKAVQKTDQKCWDACTGKQEPLNKLVDGKNITSTCFIACLFQTMLGNSTVSPPIPMMSTDAIVKPFVDSFLPLAQGGCPVVV